MGRYYWDRKLTVEECKSISVSFLNQHGFFRGYCSGRISWQDNRGVDIGNIGIVVDLEGRPCVHFNYTITDQSSAKRTDYSYNVNLETTPCNWGGFRYWFICPLIKDGIHCDRRVTKLYLPPGADHWGCRHCYELSYESRNEQRIGRFGQIGFPLKAGRQIDELYSQLKRWTYKGKPTKKVQKLKALEKRLDMSMSAW